MDMQELKSRRAAPLHTPTVLGSNAVRDISGALTALLTDMLALYLKTKKFHWHVSGPRFRNDHLMLDEQGRRSSLCDENRDVASSILIEPRIDEAEGRVWFMFESSRRPT